MHKQMQIREATALDIPQIILVLKASLGEQELPFSEEIWNYKHVNNPFGKSLVLVAEENKNIIGVRAFMRWKWQINEQVFSAFRAVDTATHPDHQGKGIFKKLTLKAVEMAKEEGGNFIFNTPNDKSRPGYLKMGWEQVDKIGVQLLLRNSIPAFNSKKIPAYEISKNAKLNLIEDLVKENNHSLVLTGKSFTPKSLNYLRWRYEQNPLQSYEVYADNQVYLAGYIKRRKNLWELRFSECIYNEVLPPEILRDKIKTWSRKFNANFVSIPKNTKTKNVFKIKGNYGPVLTLKALNLDKQYKQQLMNLDNWKYSLGDLELF